MASRFLARSLTTVTGLSRRRFEVYARTKSYWTTSLRIITNPAATLNLQVFVRPMTSEVDSRAAPDKEMKEEEGDVRVGEGVQSEGGEGVQREGGVSGEGVQREDGVSGEGVQREGGEGGVSGEGVQREGGVSGEGVQREGGVSGDSGEGVQCEGGVSGEGVQREGGGSGEGVSGEGGKYQYLQRGFTSEIFKIEIENIPKYIGYTVRALSIT